MTSEPPSSSTLISEAREALRRGERAQARRLAARAAALMPENEEAWLILAALAAPRASVEYLKRALQANPASQRARKGMHWAVRRLRQETAALPHTTGPESPPQPDGRAALPVEPKDEARSVALPMPAGPAKMGAARARAQRRAQGTRSPLAGLAAALMILIMVGALFATRSPRGGPALAWLIEQPTATSTSTVTPSPTPTLTATASPSPTPTATETATATPSPTATFTPPPTATWTPTPPPPTPQPPTQAPPTQAPPTQAPPTPTRRPKKAAQKAGPEARPEQVGPNERWIDVDLSSQTTYAMQGDTVVNSFLVSTGKWPTVTVQGVYRVYVKYRAADMYGADYYLSDVPYIMYFYEGYGLHGAYWHMNFGHPMSHGCVNMKIPDAAWIFDFAEVGTIVSVHP